jgi:hypothetical protein
MMRKLLEKGQMAVLPDGHLLKRKILTANQISELKKEIYQSEHFIGGNLLGFLQPQKPVFKEKPSRKRKEAKKSALVLGLLNPCLYASTCLTMPTITHVIFWNTWSFFMCFKRF